jgi:hypothetical protein
MPLAHRLQRGEIMTTDAAEQNLVAIEAELPPPTEPKRKDKKWRPHPREGAQTRRGPPRPYRRVAEDVLSTRIQKLTTRMERAKKQVIRQMGLA